MLFLLPVTGSLNSLLFAVRALIASSKAGIDREVPLSDSGFGPWQRRALLAARGVTGGKSCGPTHRRCGRVFNLTGGEKIGQFVRVQWSANEEQLLGEG